MDYIGAMEDRKTYYRIVYYKTWYDVFLWKVQVWRWWFPMWRTIEKEICSEREAELVIQSRTMYFEGIK